MTETSPSQKCEDSDNSSEIVDVKGINLPWNIRSQSLQATEEERKKPFLSRIGICVSLAFLGISIVVLIKIISSTDKAALWDAFVNTKARDISSAFLFTILSYSLLTCYDAAALRQLKLKVRYRVTALASFTSYAISFTLGFPIFTAGSIRYWIYAPKGLKPNQVASLTVIAGFTFLLGMAVVVSFGLLFYTGEFSKLIYYISPLIGRMIGLCAAIATAGYLFWVSLKRRIIRIQGWRFELPGFRVTLFQMIIGALDTCAAATVLYTLLPGHEVEFGAFLTIYVIASFLGIISNIPGGLGVFETTILLGLSIYPREQVLGALLLFRFIYFLFPFIVAICVLGAYEVRKHLQIASVPDKQERCDNP